MSMQNRKTFRAFSQAILLIGCICILSFALFIRPNAMAQSDACRRRLAAMIPLIDIFARSHPHRVPRSFQELIGYIGSDLQYYDGWGVVDEHRRPLKLTWRTGIPQPYLWDYPSHPFGLGTHVLYTDGSIRILPAPPVEQKTLLEYERTN